MTREEAIKQLKDNRVLCINSETEPFAIAYDMAIKALEQDAIPIPEGATNGDVVNALFDIDEGVEEVDCYGGYMYFKVKTDVWNAPYKGECNLSEKSTGSESE